MLAQAPIAAINHLLAAAPWARERLQPFAEQAFSIELAPVKLCAKITPEGLLTQSGDATPSVEISLAAAALPLMLAGMDEVFRHARISGDAPLAETLGFIARNLEWDAEEDLSRLIGDIAAHQAVNTARAFIGWQKQSAVKFAASLAEYLTEENPMLMKPAPIKPFIDEVDELRDGLARLEKRIGRLGG